MEVCPNYPGCKESKVQTAWNSHNSVYRKDILNVGLKNEKELSKQRTEKRHFRKREDELKIWGLVEQSELGELQVIPHGCHRRYDKLGMEATEARKEQ